MATKSELRDVADVLYENYYSLGVTGSEAVLNLHDDMSKGLLDGDIQEWGITGEELWIAAGLMRERISQDGDMSRMIS
jgi:hypothetical protein